MSLTTIILIAGSAWSILSISVAVPIGRAMKRADRLPRADVINWMPILPPVPPPARSAVDADWLSVWPSAVYDDELTDLEFVSLIASTWQWPDVEDAA